MTGANSVATKAGASGDCDDDDEYETTVFAIPVETTANGHTGVYANIPRSSTSNVQPFPVAPTGSGQFFTQSAQNTSGVTVVQGAVPANRTTTPAAMPTPELFTTPYDMPDMSNLDLLVHQYASITMCLSMINIIFGILAIVGPEVNLMDLFKFISGLCGFVGAKNKNEKLVLVYVMYIFFEIIFNMIALLSNRATLLLSHCITILVDALIINIVKRFLTYIVLWKQQLPPELREAEDI